jgi:hypothetical protein
VDTGDSESVRFGCLPDRVTDHLPSFPAGFATPLNATALEALREGGRITKGAADFSSENCLGVRFLDSCVATLAEPVLVGFFELWEGQCPNTAGRPAYHNPIAGMFLFYFSPGSSWAVAPECGSVDSTVAYGGAGLFPFEDTAAVWQCANSPFESGQISIECDYYDGQATPCASGSYEASGEAPNGACR